VRAVVRSGDNRGVPAIDRFLPEWDVHEVHSIELAATPEEAIAAALAAPACPDGIVRVLYRLRGLSGRGSIEDAFTRMGFDVLAREAMEVVVGAAGTPWRPAGGIRPFAEAGPGTVRMAADLRAEPLANGGSRLTTETRVAAVDAAARRRFLRYWRLVGPFSALIRRRWLRAIRLQLVRKSAP
jgi:hypothetical protein